MEPQEGDIAEDGAGNFLVYRGGDWYPAQQDGRPLERIPRPDYGSNHFQLPNGDIVRQGPRGGQDTVESFGGSGTGGGTGLAPADLRGRLTLGLGPVSEAQQRLEAIERGGYSFNDDWLARGIDAIPGGDAAARVLGGADYQRLETASRSFESAMLPVFSGAAVTESEAKRFIRANLPALGDNDETLATKSRNRRLMTNAAATLIGQELPYPDIGVFGAMFGGAPQEMSFDQAAPIAAQLGLNGGEPPPSTPAGPGSGPDAPVDISGLSAADLMNLQPGQYIRFPDGRVERLSGTPRLGANGEEVSPGVFVEEAPSAAVEQVLGGQAAFNRSALEQVPFGDELMAGFAGVMSGQGYDRMREAQQALASYDRENNQFERNMGGGAGAVAQIPVGMGAAGALPQVLRQAPRVAGATRLQNTGRVLANTARNAGGGIATGAVYGAGAGEGGLAERGGNALEGAAIGGVLGPVAGVVGERVIAPAISGVGRMIRPNALEGAVDRFGRRFDPDAGVLAQRADERAAQGLETTFVDLMDESQRGLGRALATRQTPARQAVRDFAEGRAENLPDRISRQARRNISPDPRSPAEIRDQIAATGRREAAPLYEAAYAEPFTPTPAIEDILSRPAGRAALERAARIAANEGRDPNSIGLIVSDAGPVAVRSPTMQTMDYVKRGLDDVLEGYRDSTTGRMTLDTEGRAIEGLRRDFRNELDNINPSYAAARASHSSTAALQRATELGENFLSMEADEFSRQASRLNPAEREVALAAARRAVERGAGTQGAAPGLAQRLSSGREQNMRNAALLENPIPMQDAMRAEREGVMAARAVYPGSGSITSQATSDQAQTGMNILSAGVNAVTGNIRGSVGALARLVRLGYSDQEAEALMMAAIDPNRTREVIDALARRMNRQDARSMVRSIRFATAQRSGEYAGDEE
jgi:hypothetical protein